MPQTQESKGTLEPDGTCGGQASAGSLLTSVQVSINRLYVYGVGGGNSQHASREHDQADD